MKAFILTLTVFLFPTAAKAVDCSKHKIYCSIVHLQPKVDKKYAMKLSNEIYKYSKIYKISWKRSLAILMQETSIIKGLNNVQKGLVKKTICHAEAFSVEDSTCETIYEVQNLITDIGPWQFSVHTVLLYSMNPERVEKDLAYSTEWHFKILRKKLKACGKKYPDTAWACYNTASPTKHKIYVQLVDRYYNVIVNYTEELEKEKAPKEQAP